MANGDRKAIVIATGEEVVVYRLQTGNYYDSKNWPENKPPSARLANKKEFTPDELRFVK